MYDRVVACIDLYRAFISADEILDDLDWSLPRSRRTWCLASWEHLELGIDIASCPSLSIQRSGRHAVWICRRSTRSDQNWSRQHEI